MGSVSTEAKVGLFVLVALILLAYMSFEVGEYGFGFKKGYAVNAVFENAAGLEKDASVQIAGVEVGRVEAISLKDGKALVAMRIFPAVKLEEDVIASIKSHGILGDKYIEIQAGTQGVSYIEEGGEIGQVERQADLDNLLRQVGLIAEDVKAVTASLKAVVGGEEGEASLRAILNNTRELSENLNNVVKENDENLGIMVSNLTRASQEMEKTFAALSDVTGRIKRGEGTVGKLIADDGVFDNLNETMASLNEITDRINRGEGTVGKLVKDDSVFDNLNETVVSLKEITDRINRGEGTVGKLVNDGGVADNLNETLVSMRDISDKINKGEGTIGRLVNEEETIDNLNAGLKSIDESMKGINKYVSKSEQFRTFLSYRGEYLLDKSSAKSYLNLKIQPKWDKFYIVGIVADPRGKRKVTDSISKGTTTRTEEWDKNGLLFNAEIGKRFKDVVLRGGLLESTGGIGIDYYALNDDFKFTFEAFDFDTDRDPHLKVFGEYELLKHVYLSAGWDDFLSDEGNESPFVGFSIRFEDDDLKYLLSSVPLPN